MGLSPKIVQYILVGLGLIRRLLMKKSIPDNFWYPSSLGILLFPCFFIYTSAPKCLPETSHLPALQNMNGPISMVTDLFS